MDKVNRIINHRLWQEAMAEIEALEKERIFCRHDLEHLFQTARLMKIFALEENLPFDNCLIYGAAFLHDLGRGAQYKNSIPHDEESLRLSGIILTDCGYTDDEIDMITTAIGLHRQKHLPQGSLGELLYRCDKMSRPCFYCQAQEECNWEAEKRNLRIIR